MKRVCILIMCVLQLTVLIFGEEVNVKVNPNFNKALLVAENAVGKTTIDNYIDIVSDYCEKDFKGYWVFFIYYGINYSGDGGTILVHKDPSNNWKSYFLGHDEPSPEIPKEFINNCKLVTFKKCYFYIGDKNAQVNKLSNKQIAKKEDIGQYYWPLVLMRDEILARYGKVFDDKEVNKFFLTRTWYKPNKNSNEIKLNDIEKVNIKTIDEILTNKEDEFKDESFKKNPFY